MAQDQQTVTCPANTWTQLTNADVTRITFQALMGDVYIRFTTDATTPTEDSGLLYTEGAGVTDKPLSELTELVGADRVWAKPVGNNGATVNNALVYVDHA